MRQGSEHTTSNLLVAYPFADDAIALRGEEATFPLDAFADMVLSTPETTTRAYLKSVGSDGVMTFADQEGTTVFVTDPVTMELDAGGFQLLDFADPTNRYRVRALVAFTFFGLDTGDLGDTLPLSVAAVDVDAVAVYSLGFVGRGAVSAEGPGPATGHIRLVPGYNMQLNQSGDSLSISAVPGAGKGVQPCSERHDLQLVKAPSQLRPDQTGGLFIQGDGGCLKVDPDRGTGVLTVKDECGPCCDCKDFARFYNELAGYLTRLKETKEQIIFLHEAYNSLVEFWNGNFRQFQRSTVTEEVGGMLHAVAGPDGASGRLLIAYVVYNMTCDPIEIHDAGVGQPVRTNFVYRKKWTLWRDDTYNDHPRSNIWVPDTVEETEGADEDLMWDDVGENELADTIHSRRVILEPGESALFAALLGATNMSQPFGVKPRLVHAWATFSGVGMVGTTYHKGKLGTEYEVPVASGAGRGPNFSHRTTKPYTPPRIR